MALVARFPFATHPIPLRRSCRRGGALMASSSFPPSTTSPAASSVPSEKHRSQRKLPVLLFDVMDTLVRDPFYDDIPAFFQMSMKELLEQKHPTAWAEFEKGLINESELAGKFFKDGRSIDLEGLKGCMVKGYSYLDGIEELLQHLKHYNYEIHAFTNYPIWYMMIEEKLKLSNYLSWTFCSCTLGKRKPDSEIYKEVLHQLGVEPGSCVFIDDRKPNVDAAANAGMVGLRFRNAVSLKQDLHSLGIEIQQLENS